MFCFSNSFKKATNLIKESNDIMRKKESDLNRINNLKKNLQSKNFNEITNKTLKNLKDERNFDLVDDLRNKLAINNEYDKLINLNNKNASANDKIENYKNKDINIHEKEFGRRIKNNKIDDYSKNNFMLKVNQLNYNSESRNLNNNSNKMLDIFDSKNYSKEANKEGRKIDNDIIKNEKNNARNIHKNENQFYLKEDNENNLNIKDNKNSLGITKLRMMDPIGK